MNDEGPGQKHVLIVVVSHSRNPDFETNRMIAMATPNLLMSGWRVSNGVHVGDADLAGARNFGLASFIHQRPLTDLLLVDNDVSCEPGGIERLLSHPVDLVFGAYPRRSDNGGYAVGTFPEGGRLLNPLTGEPDPGGLLKTPGGLTGFMRISRRCAEKMSNLYSEDWYTDGRLPADIRVSNLFQFAVIDHERYTEDVFFCKRWRDLGETVWCDPHILMHHHGTKTYSGKFIDHLVKQNS